MAGRDTSDFFSALPLREKIINRHALAMINGILKRHVAYRQIEDSQPKWAEHGDAIRAPAGGRLAPRNVCQRTADKIALAGVFRGEMN